MLEINLFIPTQANLRVINLMVTPKTEFQKQRDFLFVNATKIGTVSFTSVNFSVQKNVSRIILAWR